MHPSRLWAFALYPVGFAAVAAAAFVRVAHLPQAVRAGEGMGTAWLAFVGAGTLPGYAWAVLRLSGRLRRLPARRALLAAVLAAIGVPALVAAGFALPFVLKRAAHTAADGLLIVVPLLAPVLAVRGAYAVAAWRAAAVRAAVV